MTGIRGFKFVQMKGHTLFHRKIITKLLKYINQVQKSSSSANLNQIWHKTFFDDRGLKIEKKRIIQFLKKKIVGVFSPTNQPYDIIKALLRSIGWFRLVSQVSDVAHGPLVLLSIVPYGKHMAFKKKGNRFFVEAKTN